MIQLISGISKTGFSLFDVRIFFIPGFLILEFSVEGGSLSDSAAPPFPDIFPPHDAGLDKPVGLPLATMLDPF